MVGHNKQLPLSLQNPKYLYIELFRLLFEKMEIRLLKRDEIDKARWNGCVYYSPNSLIYGFTWYLDNVCEQWEGLVEGDYESVFPLVWNNKLLGIKRLYQPYLCQQLGLFTVNGFSQKRIKAFIEAIPKEYKYIDIHLNERNIIDQLEGFEVEARPNYLLPLSRPYTDIYAGYSSNLKRNLKKAEKAGIYGSASIKPENFVALLRQEQEKKGNHFPERLYHAAHRVIYNCLHRGQGVIMGAFEEQEHELCAAVFWMFNGARTTNLLNFTTDKGRQLGAMHQLIDMYIQGNAGRPIYIDFEGSSIESIARFYQSFGAENQPFYRLKQNRLPWWMKWKK